MGVYLDLTDLSDPSLTFGTDHVTDADVYVDAVLAERGIYRSDVTLPNELLTRIAIYWAKRCAAIEGAIGDNSPLIAKAREYENNAKQLVGTISKKALGITDSVGFGVVTLGRG
ncbi:hypothetical protein HC024_00180 [Methylococcaceae bacterium WWC4]|nr:hypothetical protein [Methylococcaceae bacterium WWC4]